MTPQELVKKEKQQVQTQGQEKTRPGVYYTPDVDIREAGDSLKLWADMPGVSDKDLSVTLENNILTIEGMVSTSMYEGLSPRYTEYNVGNYLRQFTLNETIDPGRIKASLRNGVLELDLPKVKKARLRKIEVRPAQEK
jgi:HSP20 family protein